MGAAKRLEGKGKSLSWLIEKELEANPLQTLKVMASFNPRQVNVDNKHTIEINEIIQVVTERQKAKLVRGEVISEQPRIAQSITPKAVTVEPSCCIIRKCEGERQTVQGGSRLSG
jgi:hypothetical protein